MKVGSFLGKYGAVVIAIAVGIEAEKVLQSGEFLNSWIALCQRCPWATVFQRPEFVCTWLESYTGIYEPVCVWEETPAGELSGLLVLGNNRKNGQMVIAGAHQAEYQSWLSGENDSDFLIHAVKVLEHRFGIMAINFRYIPPGMATAHLLVIQNSTRRVEIISRKRPVKRIEGADQDAVCSGGKNKNYNRLRNRLQKLGNLNFLRVKSVDEFEKYFDQIIAYYDQRQFQANMVAPFQQDTIKKGFHLQLLRRNPEKLHVTLTLLNDVPMAAHIGMLSDKQLHLGIIAHSPAHEDLSLGKYHLLALERLLAKEGVVALDLTPGGDPWKDTFANDFDLVHELIIHKSTAVCWLSKVRRNMLSPVKRSIIRLVG